MDGEYGLDIPVEVSPRIGVLQVYRHKARLPVMAVDQIRLEADHRKGVQCRLLKEAELLQIPEPVPVGAPAREVILVVDEVISNAVYLGLEDPHISVLSEIVHIEVGNILKLTAHFLFHAQIFRQHDPAVKIFSVDIFRQGTHNIRETACFDKRNRFARQKQNFLHFD